MELPDIILKTRALLALRSYKTDELLEYEDRYEMHAKKEDEDQDILSAIWIFREPRVVGVAVIRELIKKMEEINALEGVLVGGERITPAAKKLARSERVEIVEGGYSSFDLFGHELVPDHVIAEEEEVELVLKHYGIERPSLPRMLADDPAAKILGAKPGQVVRIERRSPTAGKTYYYRLIVGITR